MLEKIYIYYEFQSASDYRLTISSGLKYLSLRKMFENLCRGGWFVMIHSVERLPWNGVWFLPSLHNGFASQPLRALTQKEIDVYGEPGQGGKHEIRHRLWRGEFN